MNKKTYYAILILSIIALIFSIIIEVEKSEKENETICSVIGGGCDVVQTSVYGTILGVSNPVYGIIGFSILIILSLLQLRKHHHVSQLLIIIGSFAAGLLALWFIIVQLFILKTFCVYCIVVDSISITLLIISILYLIQLRKTSSKEFSKTRY